MSLQLDSRQRAMLAEMKVAFWWPQSHAGAAASETTVSVSVSESTTANAAATATATAPMQPAAPSAFDVDTLDWPALHDTVMSCTRCALCEGRKSPVFAMDPLPVQADWLIVGEPPDAQEERAGSPFVGNAGQLLDNMLRAVQCARGGRGRAGARVTSVVKCRPSEVRNPSVEELAQCAVYLRREIALTQPRVIVAMGRFAALSLLAADHPAMLQMPFGQVRGKVYQLHGLPVVVTYHPSKLLRAPLEKASAWADLCLARAQLESAPAPLPSCP